MLRGATLLLAALLAWTACGDVSGMRVEVYPLGLMDFELAAKIAGEIVSPEGKLFPDKAGQRLIVLETEERHAALRKALEKLNVPPKHVRLRVTFQDAQRTSQRAIHVEGQATIDGVRVKTGSSGPQGASVSVVGDVRDATASSLVEQELLVISGGRAKLFIGQEVPDADWFWTWGCQRGFWTGTLRWREVGASMLVEPYVIDRRIRLRLTPEFSYLLDGRRMATAVESLTTEVIVEDGQDLDLGGLPTENREFTSRFLTGFTHAGERRALGIRLRAQVEP